MLRNAARSLLVLLIQILVIPAGQPATGYVETGDGVNLFYEVLGNGGKTVIIPGHLFAAPYLSGLSEHFTVILYDMRNRGRSDRVSDTKAITIQKDVDDLETIRAHFSAERASLVGFSYLGKMIVLYAGQYPGHVQELVQIGPVSIDPATRFPAELTANDPEPLITEELNGRFRSMEAEGFHVEKPREYCLLQNEVWEKYMVGDPSDPSALEGYKERICELPNEWPVNLRRHLDAHLESILALEFTPRDVENIMHRALIIHGTMDRNAPYGGGRQWANYLPHARLLTIEDAAHMVMAEHRDQVLSAITTFLQGHWPEAAEDVGDWRVLPE
jgi:pimeloyl-ACP methyl ester carboxylesterase